MFWIRTRIDFVRLDLYQDTSGRNDHKNITVNCNCFEVLDVLFLKDGGFVSVDVFLGLF